MLYIVATPIGNLDDITLRARDILKKVPYVACEDTRQTKVLLQKIESNAQTISFHAHSDKSKIDKLIQLMQDANDVALVSDAGTPGIADPGGVLVEAAHKAGIIVSPLPGPSATIAALSASGFVSDQYVFMGFLPKKKGRQTALFEIRDEKRAVVFFESPHRIAKTLEDLHTIVSDKRICVCRELTKKFEEVLVGTAEELLARGVRDQGEFVLVVEGK